MSWFKRRAPTRDELKAVEVINIVDLQFKHMHPIEMTVKCNDGEIYELTGYVHHNTIKDTWTLQGLNPHGLSVVLDFEEE